MFSCNVGWNVAKATMMLTDRATALEQTEHQGLSSLGAFAKRRANVLQKEYTDAMAECDRKHGGE